MLLATILFGIGLVGLLARRNVIFILMSLEVMPSLAILSGFTHTRME